DLRTLYVACTRAEDYLVLSAALPSNFSPATSWMLALAERFDLKTGRCLVPVVSEERTPKVRVTDLLSPPPECPAATPFVPPVLPEFEAATEVPETVQEMRPPSVVPASHLHELTAEGLAPQNSFTHAYQFDAEDGSDRSDWQRPRQRIERVADTEAGLR